MARSLLFSALCLLAACATFDRTNIAPGQRVYGPGISFETPSNNTWSASEYGSGNRLRLIQINHTDSYYLNVEINRGPLLGMYTNAEQHLNAFLRHQRKIGNPDGYEKDSHIAWVDQRFGDLCVRYQKTGRDWAGRNNKGPAIVESEGLICAHQNADNTLLHVELTRRSEETSPSIDLRLLGEQLFSSIDYIPF